MKMTAEVFGFRDLEAAMADLTKAAGRGVMTRALRNAAQPLKADIVTFAPFNGIKESVAVSTKLDPREKRLSRGQQKSTSMVFVGPSYDLGSGGRLAHLFEYGTGPRFRKNGGATGRLAMRPFMRPAWDAYKGKAIDLLKFEMAVEIDKATKRAQRKAARQARGK